MSPRLIIGHFKDDLPRKYCFAGVKRSLFNQSIGKPAVIFYSPLTPRNIYPASDFKAYDAPNSISAGAPPIPCWGSL